MVGLVGAIGEWPLSLNPPLFLSAILMGILPYVGRRIMISRDLPRCRISSRRLRLSHTCMKKEKKVGKIHPSIGPSISQFDRFFWRWHKQKLGRPPLPGHQGLGYSRNHQVFIVLLLTFHGQPSLLIGHNRTGRIWRWEIIFPFPSVSS